MHQVESRQHRKGELTPLRDWSVTASTEHGVPLPPRGHFNMRETAFLARPREKGGGSGTPCSVTLVCGTGPS